MYIQLPATQPLEESSFRRKLSKREKRNLKKENKLRKMKNSQQNENDPDDGNDAASANGNVNSNRGSVAEKLYTGFFKLPIIQSQFFNNYLGID